MYICIYVIYTYVIYIIYVLKRVGRLDCCYFPLSHERGSLASSTACAWDQQAYKDTPRTHCLREVLFVFGFLRMGLTNIEGSQSLQQYHGSSTCKNCFRVCHTMRKVPIPPANTLLTITRSLLCLVIDPRNKCHLLCLVRRSL